MTSGEYILCERYFKILPLLVSAGASTKTLTVPDPVSSQQDRKRGRALVCGRRRVAGEHSRRLHELREAVTRLPQRHRRRSTVVGPFRVLEQIQGLVNEPCRSRDERRRVERIET